MDYVSVLVSHVEWLKLVWKYKKRRQKKKKFRRWWVKPHIRDHLRGQFGAYEIVFLYFANYDHEEFHRITRMIPDQFNALHDALKNRLLKTSRRRPLSTELRLALALE